MLCTPQRSVFTAAALPPPPPPAGEESAAAGVTTTWWKTASTPTAASAVRSCPPSEVRGPRSQQRRDHHHRGADTPATGHADVAAVASPAQQELCRLIGTGAWREALAMLYRQLRAGDTSSGCSVDLPSHPCFSLQEVCILALLWRGEIAAAWHVWQCAVQCAAAASWASPRVALLLSLATHIVERDAARTRDALLLCEVELGAFEAAAGGSGGRRARRDAASPAEAGDRWWRLLLEWLWSCNECADRRSGLSLGHCRRRIAGVLAAIVERLATSMLTIGEAAAPGRLESARSRTLALMLLTLRDACGASGEGRCLVMEGLEHLRTSGVAAAGGAAEVRAVVVVVEDAIDYMATGAFSPVTVAAPPSRGKGHGARNALERRRTRERLHATLSQAEARMRRLRGDGDGSGTTALTVYRMWHACVVECDGLGRGWLSIQSSLHASQPSPPPSPSPPSTPSARTAQREATDSARRHRLRSISAATQCGDWVTAVRLSLGDDAVDDHTRAAALVHGAQAGPPVALPTAPVSPEEALGWSHRVDLGLAACAAASPPGASWQGVLALWRCVSKHAGAEAAAGPDVASPRHRCAAGTTSASPALLRQTRQLVFQLATAGRWAEALACFHDVPDACLDGGVESQVLHAVRHCPAGSSRAAMDVWAAWRCRVGDAVDPIEAMTSRLLAATLFASAAADEHVAFLSSALPESPVAVAAKTATALLVAAATPSVTPGAVVPLDWQLRRDLVRRVLSDRWVGTWAEALQVALASGDVKLLVHDVAWRVPATHQPTLYGDAKTALSSKGVALSPTDRVMLLALWCRTRQSTTHEDGSVGAHETREVSESGSVTAAAPATGEAQSALATEALLNELLGVD
ncbi:hypothetical protein NESM_000230700 [Novymonas esmeraldas]|uniref:Uncharacterized protein n=1 Tax=Novymonas esmeraldas TaxID=1808958 RepID=A0AAW0F5X1_9TRYP